MSKKLFNPLDFIPKPCKEDWNQMTGNEKRRHCEKCDTHVVDLTGLSSNEILSLREKHGGKLCGAFRLGRMGSSMVKPLALGSSIATLALASCNKAEPKVVGEVCASPVKEEPRVVGEICAPPKKEIPPRPVEKRAEPKIEEPIHPEILLGDICIPPADPNKDAI